MALKQIEELRLTNKKKNDEARKQQEEEEKCRKDEAEEERRRTEEEAVQNRVAMTPQNLHDILNGVDKAQLDDMVCSGKGDAESQEEERLPLKKRTGSSKSSSRRARLFSVTPSKDTSITKLESISTRSMSFLDAFV